MTTEIQGGDRPPTVSVVMPIRNEAPHLERAISSILSQDYPSAFDICLAVAPSDDGTEAVAAAIAEREPRVRVVPNPAGITPAGLNAAIAATSGEIVVRVDGHAELCDGYIRRAVDTMQRTGADNVGGVQAAAGDTPFERAVAAAMTSWFGTGGSRFHVGGDEGPVDTVYLGVFDRAAGDAVGWFDESLIRNQDYELNIRLREAGGVIWFDPALSVSYRPRGTLRALAKQYFEYGWWKAEVVRRHPGSLRARQVAPALSLIAQAGALLAFRSQRRAALPAVAYLGSLGLAASRSAGADRSRYHRARVALALWMMHQAWAAGLLISSARGLVSRRAAGGHD
jgi:succinoglycan biosynthesis protein ExoA